MFRELWNKLGLWQDDVVTFPGSPIAFAKSIGLLDYPTLLAHVNHCTDAELDLLAPATPASSIAPARTHTSAIRRTDGERCCQRDQRRGRHG